MLKLISPLLACAALALSACAQTPTPAENPQVVDVGGSGQCRIEDWQSYVGKTRQSLPTAPQGLVFRVLCKECAATMDYRTDRVNFSYDDKDIITRVSCG